MPSPADILDAFGTARPWGRPFVPDEDPRDRELAERIRRQSETPEPFRSLSTVDADELPEWMLDTLKS